MIFIKAIKLIQKSFYLFFIAIGISILFTSNVSAKSMEILYIPIDNRPVSLDYVKKAVNNKEITLITPPFNLIASRESKGKPDELWQWLINNIKNKKVAVISIDSLIYGGLVSSRTHDLSYNKISERIMRLKELKDKFPRLKLYCFSSLLRTPRESYGDVEPQYYEKYGKYFFRIGELSDKEDLYGLDELDQIELKNMHAVIPEDYHEDWFNRRKKNMKAHIFLAQLSREKYFHYYAVGKDDNAPLSQTHKEARYLKEQTKDISSAVFQIIPGIDQLGLLLITRAINESKWLQPYIYPFYSDGRGASTIPLYSDQSIGESVELQIFAMGALPAPNIQKADLALAINTPFDGTTLEAISPENMPFPTKHNIKLIKKIKQINQINKKPVALADIAYANGADNGFMNEMYKQNALKNIVAYSAWNTADNSIGYVLSLGLLSKKQDSKIQKEIIETRFIEDWFYQANARQRIEKTMLKNNMNIYYLDDNINFAEKLLDKELRKINERYDFLQIQKYKYSFPWNRLFDISVI